MATQPTDYARGNAHPARMLAPVIRQSRYGTVESERVPWFLIILALTVSLAVNAAVLSSMLLIPFTGSTSDSQQKDLTVIKGDVEDEVKKDDLTNDEEGLNPAVPSNLNMERVEPVTVPGTEKKDEAPGIPGAPEARPVNIPPPPGIGNLGTGGGIDSLIKGKGSTVGTPGGVTDILMRAGGFGGRSGSTRQQMLEEYGGTKASEAAVGMGLQWLARHQAPDGHWSLDNFRVYGQCNCTESGQNQDIAATAFGVLPFLGAGETHKGNPDSKGKYQKTVDKALRYLILKQSASGDFSSGSAEMYAHGLAAIAICEAYGLTSDPRLKGPAQRAINFIVHSQSRQGGWSYNAPCTGHDTSVGGWELMALKSGQMAGLEVPSSTIERAKKWLDDVAEPDGSQYAYQFRGQQISRSTCAVGLLCREYIQWGPRNPSLRKGVKHLLEPDNLPGKQRDMYYYYYATQVMHHFGGEAWQRWNPLMRDYLVATQDKGTTPKHQHQRGSWDPAGDVWKIQGGRLMVTSLSVLTLEVYYRHLPLYRRDMGGGKK
ncbi:MAG TPA: prenyltransferase/squalene oxidase repeat-containing protein [Gemmataceae bacterium]|nr:prenyltransferase/squalene oxidase repeat-containing protein [Gemmataceae bacterium]